MIISLEGTLLGATPLTAIVEVNGIGYEVHVPVTTAERLPDSGQRVKLHTHAVYREDSQTLFGFHSAEERDFFRLLIEKVSGVGPKVALSIMSKLALPVLKSAIAGGDVRLLAQSPGIGKKTAERLIVELKDKIFPGGIGQSQSSGAASSGNPLSASPSAANIDSPELRLRDAVLALTALGYKVADADKAVRRAALKLGPGASTEELVKQALN